MACLDLPPEAKIWTHSKALLASKDMDGRQHSATGVLLHSLTPIEVSTSYAWVAIHRLVFTLAARFATVAAGLSRSGMSQNMDPFQGAPGQ